MAFGGMVELARKEVRLQSCGKASFECNSAVLGPCLPAERDCVLRGSRIVDLQSPGLLLPLLITIKMPLLTRPGISP